MSLHFTYWDEARFLAAREEWQQLLDHSQADPLFLSWHWLSAWWQIWRKPDDQLVILAAYDANELQGLAPMMLSRDHYLRRHLPVTRLQFLGHRFQGANGILSEYLDLILHRNASPALAAQLIERLDQDHRCDEWILANVPEDGVLARQLPQLGPLRELAGNTAYQVDTGEGDFQAYCAGLGRNTRLKLFNRRKLLEQLGRVQLIPLQDCGLEAFVDALNRFHRHRFGGRVFGQRTLDFLRHLQSLPGAPDFAQDSSLLAIDDQILSVIFNLRAGRCLYNIQLGYRQDFHKKISLGTLHLGYAIEAAFADPDIDCFDFLLGEGKNSNYKQHLASRSRPAHSWQQLRSPLLKTLFALNDNGKRLIRRFSSN